MTQKTINELKKLISDKLARIQTIIQHTISQFNYFRKFDIIANSDMVLCSSTLSECYEKSQGLLTNLSPECETYNTIDHLNVAINELQSIIDKLSIIMCGYGTKFIEDIFFISFGTEVNMQTDAPVYKSKFDLIMEHVRPIGYKTIHWKQCKSKPKLQLDEHVLCQNKITEEAIQIELSNQYECFDIDMNAKPVFVKIYGIRVVVHNEKTQKTLIIQGVVEDVPLECITNTYIEKRKSDILSNIPKSDTFRPEIVNRIVETMTIKDILIHGNEDVYKKHMAVLSEVNYIKYNKLSATIKKFLELDVYGQRHMLIHLLIYNAEIDIQYITYLLYDLITSRTGGDSFEQQLIYDSFPWKVKMYFKETMKTTMKYTKDMLTKYDISRVSLEQQIYVMKVPDNVREKAMVKLKEIKGKSDDNGGKAKQYLEGLLKIPFGIYREESVLSIPKQLNVDFSNVLSKHGKLFQSLGLTYSAKYNTIEIAKYASKFQEFVRTSIPRQILEKIEEPKIGTKLLNSVFSLVLEERKHVLKKTGLSKSDKVEAIKDHIFACSAECVLKIYDLLHGSENTSVSLLKSTTELDRIIGSTKQIRNNLDQIVETLDESIHGHSHAKDQILKIVAQWMNGEQSGYCFGFEGSPGIGKTSLAKKGLANCLKDANGESRPFAFIALGGSCNGSTLEGHSYTYINSTWGRIVDILMDTKCMNPIIYVDELDKVSKTEHGKEIIGILTHLIDTTQNSGFQDKYFSGIDIDLSKVLFIFSYNDPSQIDSILLDRIHRIRFDNLSLEEKVVIVRKYLLPEINKKMGLENCVDLSDEVVEYLIETYTLESGVRKLKELIFDLYGEINVQFLKCDNPETIVLPISVQIEDLQTRYLSKYDPIVEKTVHRMNEVGIINGLWANSLGRGGIIPIQVHYFPTSTFLELRLTGMQGDVMKESMNVSKTMAWNLLSQAEQQACIQSFESTKSQGLHIHCPEGAVSKDGPSAGAAITVAIYSRLRNQPINNTVAMTGEINLQGYITEIGGLEYKILGGIRAGIKKFLYPKRNEVDFAKFMKKYGSKSYIQDIAFVAVDRIEETFSHFFAME
jgi:ATP-dependent Lon protease